MPKQVSIKVWESELPMKILYLYAEVMGYTMATIKELVNQGAEVHVVSWSEKKKTDYQAVEVPGVTFYGKDSFGKNALIDLATALDPAITVVSGWMDRDYLSVAAALRRMRKLVVCGLDGQWHGTARQRLAGALGSVGYFDRYYSHVWVAGVWQYEYARRLGFKRSQIVYDLLSADLEKFSKRLDSTVSSHTSQYPHRFIFVGRLEAVKGLDILLAAWSHLGARRGDWELLIIGSGSMRTLVSNAEGVFFKDFLQPEQLSQERANAGCFVLPSRREPWGVVVHEFAAAGLPILASDVVGAASTFVIDGYNGFIFQPESVMALRGKLEKIIACSDDELRMMGRRSHELSSRITPQTSAANLLSVIDRQS